MKSFDFNICPHCPQRIEWLKKNQNKKMSEEEFCTNWIRLWEHSRAKHKGSRNSPSNARNTYRGLKRKFGFFQ